MNFYAAGSHHALEKLGAARELSPVAKRLMEILRPATVHEAPAAGQAAVRQTAKAISPPTSLGTPIKGKSLATRYTRMMAKQDGVPIGEDYLASMIESANLPRAKLSAALRKLASLPPAAAKPLPT